MNNWMRDLTFGAPGWLWALAAIPALVLLFAWAERQAGKRLAALLATPRLRAQLTGQASAARRQWRFALLLLGLAALAVTLAEPRLGYEMQETHRRGLDVIAIVDVSKSMLATDIAPNRLTRARLALHDLADQMQGDRLGLVAFAGTAFLQAPLTADYDAVLNAASELDTDLIPEGGTNIGGAIDLAIDAFGKGAVGNRAIVLMTDGEPTEDTDQAIGLKAAQRAAEAGIKIFTIGFGTTDGSLIPLGGDKGDYVRDSDGQLVRTKLNESGLRDIAQAGGGFYTHFESGSGAIRKVVEEGLARMKTGDIDARSARRPIERYQWPLGLALLALTAGAFLGERRKARAPAAAKAASKPAMAVAASALALCCLAGQASRAADASSDPLNLYQSGHYDEAYHAFENLAGKNPGQQSFDFDAGASAYRGKQYGEALDAFAKALTSSDPALQAKANYNFGNSLFRRGQSQKDKQARITDWRNAIEHYDTTLNGLKADPAHTDPELSANAAFNRDLVKRLLEEEKKQPQQQNKQDKKDKNQDQKDQQDKQDSQGGGQQQDQQKQQGDQQQQQQNQDSQGSSGQQNDQQQQNGGQQNKQDSSQSGGQSQQNQPPSPQSQQQQQQPSQGNSGEKKQQGNQGNSQNNPPQPQQNGDGQSPDSHDSGTPQNPAPGQDQPRQRGDFKSRPSEDKDKDKDKGQDGQAGQEGSEPPEQAGKMSPAQARALLESLKNEDQHVNLNADAEKQRREQPVLKDW